MHPSQIGPFRKTLIVLLTVAFGGALMVYTAMANLSLLNSVYADPQFSMFGLLALEGGVIFWTGYYLLHLNGIHKAISLFALGLDTLFSGVGFFYEMERVTNAVGTVQLPPIIVVISACVIFNVIMALITKLIPDGSRKQEVLLPKNDATYEVKEEGPNPFVLMAKGATSSLMDKAEQAIETRKQRKSQVQVANNQETQA